MMSRIFAYKRHAAVFQAALLTLTLTGLGFFLSHDLNVNFWDEGYLWNNAVRAFEGAVPIRDFRAYDPGRYYWVAAFFSVFGKGFFSLRLSLLVMQVIGLFPALLLIRTIVKNNWLFLFSGVLVFLWMFPRNKMFETSFVWLALPIAVRLIESPSRRTAFVAGLLTGLAAFFGKNLGLYNGLSFLALFVYLGYKQPIKDILPKAGFWLVGVLAGYAPMLWMFVFEKNFFTSFLDANFRVFSDYSPVKPLPIPWPWNFDPFLYTAQFLVGVSFLVVFAYLFAGIMLLLRCKNLRSPYLVASIFLGVPVLHHTLSRSDFTHLALSIPALMVGLLSVFNAPIHAAWKKIVRVVGAMILLVLAWCVLITSSDINDGLEKIKLMAGQPSWLGAYTFQGEQIWLPAAQVLYLEGLEKCFIDDLAPDENYYIAPFETVLYPLFNKTAPVWDAYPLHYEYPAKEREQIQQLQEKQVTWALIWTNGLDNNPALSFKMTHPLIWNFLQEQYEPVVCPVLSQTQILFRIRLASDPGR